MSKNDDLKFICGNLGDYVEAVRSLETLEQENIRGMVNNDTYDCMPWLDFIEVLKNQGFIEGYKNTYEMKDEYRDGIVIRKEQEVIYYHPDKGLILWASSHCTTLHEGKLYGEVILTESKIEEIRNILAQNQCSRGPLIKNDICQDHVRFSKDIRNNLIQTIKNIENVTSFSPRWNEYFLLTFVNHAETLNKCDFKITTRSKIEKCPKRIQEIINEKIW